MRRAPGRATTTAAGRSQPPTAAAMRRLAIAPARGNVATGSGNRSREPASVRHTTAAATQMPRTASAPRITPAIHPAGCGPPEERTGGSPGSTSAANERNSRASSLTHDPHRRQHQALSESQSAAGLLGMARVLRRPLPPKAHSVRGEVSERPRRGTESRARMIAGHAGAGEHPFERIVSS